MRSSDPSERRPAALAVLVLVLVACGGGGGQGGERPTPTPAPTAASPTPGPTPTAVPNPFTIAAAVAPGTQPAVAFGAGRHLVTFGLPATGFARDLVGVRLDAGGGAIDDVPVLLSNLGEDSFLDPADATYGGAAIAFDGSDFGVFFRGIGVVRGSGPPGQVVAFTSVPPAGAPLQPATEVDTQASFGMAQTSISLVSGASTFAGGFAGLYLRTSAMVGFPFTLGTLDRTTVAVDGDAIDVRGPFVLSRSPATRALVYSAGPGGIATRGTDAFAAWTQVEVDVAPPAPHVAGATLEGALLGPLGEAGITLAQIAVTTGTTAVASDGREFLVVWEAGPLDDASATKEIRAIRYRPAQGDEPAVVEPAGGFLVADGPERKSLVGVAFGGGTYLVAWLEGGTLRGARIADDGTDVAPFVIHDGPVTSAALTTDGERCLVVAEKSNGPTVDVIGIFVTADD